METILIRDDNSEVVQGLFNLAIAHTKLTVAAASGRNATAFKHAVVRVTATAAMNIAVGTVAVSATLNDHYIPANTPTNVYIGKNTHIAAIGTGDVYFSELGA